MRGLAPHAARKLMRASLESQGAGIRMSMQSVHMRILRLTLDVRAQLVKWRKEKLIRRMQIIQCSIHRLAEAFRFLRAFFRETRVLGQRNNKFYEKASLCPCFRPRLGSVRGNLPLVWSNLVLHPTRQCEGFAGRTSPGAAFAAAGTLVLHGPRSSAIAVVKFFLLSVQL